MRSFARTAVAVFLTATTATAAEHQIVTLAGGGPDAPPGAPSPLLFDPISELRVPGLGDFAAREGIATPPLCDPSRDMGCVPLSREVVYLGAACDTLELAHDALAGKIALIDRSGCPTTIDPDCTQYHGCNQNAFVNKNVLAASKGALAIIVANHLAFDADADPGERSTLVEMSWGNFLDPPVVPALFVTNRTGNLLKEALTSGPVVVEMIGGFNLGDGGPATAAQFRFPMSPLFDAYGILFVGANRIHKVRRIAPDGTITTVVGSHRPRLFGDGGPALGAGLFIQWGMAFDAWGNLFLADQANHRIRKVEARPGLAIDGSETITTVAGGGEGGACDIYNLNPTGACLQVSPKMDATPATSGKLGFPISLVFDRWGNLYFYDNTPPAQPPATGTLRKITACTAADGSALPIDGSEPLTTIATTIFASALTFDREGNLFVANGPAGVVKWVAQRDSSGEPLPIDGTEERVTVAGAGTLAPANGLAARDVRLPFVASLSFDAAGNLYLTAPQNDRVFKISAGAGSIDGSEPITTVAGTGARGFAGDGLAPTAATLNSPHGVLAGPNVIFTDGENHRVRRLNLRADVVVAPGELSLASQGKWVTFTVRFTDENAAQRAASVRRLELQRINASGAARERIPASRFSVEDVDGDGVAETIAKFDRAEVQSWGTAGTQLRLRVEGMFERAPGEVVGEFFSGEAKIPLVE